MTFACFIYIDMGNDQKGYGKHDPKKKQMLPPT